MIHDARMRQLVQQHIVDKMLRQKQQVVGQIDVLTRRATSPTAGAGVDFDIVERQTMPLRQGIQTGWQHQLGIPPQSFAYYLLQPGLKLWIREVSPPRTDNLRRSKLRTCLKPTGILLHQVQLEMLRFNPIIQVYQLRPFFACASRRRGRRVSKPLLTSPHVAPIGTVTMKPSATARNVSRRARALIRTPIVPNSSSATACPVIHRSLSSIVCLSLKTPLQKNELSCKTTSILSTKADTLSDNGQYANLIYPNYQPVTFLVRFLLYLQRKIKKKKDACPCNVRPPTSV